MVSKLAKPNNDLSHTIIFFVGGKVLKKSSLNTDQTARFKHIVSDNSLAGRLKKGKTNTRRRPLGEPL